MLCNKSSPHSLLLCVAHFTAIENRFRHTAHFTSLSFVRFHPIHFVAQQQSWLYLFTFKHNTRTRTFTPHDWEIQSKLMTATTAQHEKFIFSGTLHTLLPLYLSLGEVRICIIFLFKIPLTAHANSRWTPSTAIVSYSQQFTSSPFFFFHSINFQMIKKRIDKAKNSCRMNETEKRRL